MVHTREGFTKTSTEIAREAGVVEQTVRDYADKGLLRHIKLATGVRLFQPSAATVVRDLKAQRLSRCGHHPRGRKA